MWAKAQRTQISGRDLHRAAIRTRTGLFAGVLSRAWRARPARWRDRRWSPVTEMRAASTASSGTCRRNRRPRDPPRSAGCPGSSRLSRDHAARVADAGQAREESAARSAHLSSRTAAQPVSTSAQEAPRAQDGARWQCGCSLVDAARARWHGAAARRGCPRYTAGAGSAVARHSAAASTRVVSAVGLSVMLQQFVSAGRFAPAPCRGTALIGLLAGTCPRVEVMAQRPFFVTG